MSYITKNGITIDSEEDLLARASNLGLSPEDFKAQYIAPGEVDVEDEVENEKPEFQGRFVAVEDPPKEDEEMGVMDYVGLLWKVSNASRGAATQLTIPTNLNKPSEKEWSSYKKREEVRKSDPRWVEQNTSTKIAMSQWLSSEENVKNAIGDTDINWEHLSRKSQGNEDLYNNLAKAVKAQFPETEGGLSGMDLDLMVRGIVADKGNLAAADRLKKQEEEYSSIIIEQNLTDDAVEANMLNTTVKSLSPELQVIAEQNAILRDMRKKGVKSPEQQAAIKAQEDVVQELLSASGGFFGDAWWNDQTYNQLISWDGAVIGTPVEGDKESDDAFEVTAGDLAAIKAKIEATGESVTDMTYAGHIESLMNTNSKDLFLHQETGKEMHNITVNDASAWHLLSSLGISPTGHNDLGFEYDIPKNILARHYKTIVESDSEGSDLMGGAKLGNMQRSDDFSEFYKNLGLTRQETIALMGSSGGSGSSVGRDSNFKSKTGYFGLSSKNKGYDDPDSWWDLVPFTNTQTEEPEFGANDKSRNFKLMLRDFRDNKKDILQERGVLTDMHVLNINPATKTDNFLQETVDFFKRGGEVVAENFGLESEQWLSTDAVDINWSNRKEKDIMQSIHDQNGGVVTTTEMVEEIKRGAAYEVYEGVAAFVPALVEFALIDVAAKKTGLLTGIPRLAKAAYRAARGAKRSIKTGRAIANITNFTGHAIYEEVKMSIAFDEHYHMGGGVGFYSVGRMLGGLKFVKNPGMLKTIVDVHGKGGLAGMISVPVAANLEAVIRDVAGNEKYMTYIQDTYFDDNNEFHLGKHARGGMIDFFVFSSLGIKGFATKEGRNAYRPVDNNFGIGNSKTTWIKGLKTLEAENLKVLESADRKMKIIDKLLNSKVRGQLRNEFVLDGKKLNRSELEARKEGIVTETKKFADLYLSLNNRINSIVKHQDWQDPAKAKEMVERSMKNISHLFPDVKIIASGEVPLWVADKDAAAEFNEKENSKYINTTKASPGKLPHEIVHVAMVKAFAKNPKLAIKMKAELQKIFDTQPFYVNDGTGKAGGTGGLNKGKDQLGKMSLGEFIRSVAKGKNLQAHEYVAYAAELLADPRNYSILVQRGVFKNVETKFKDFMTKQGKIDFDISNKDQLIRFMYNFTESVKSGTLNQNQVNKFQNMDKESLFQEPNSYDARTPEKKAEMEVDMAFNSQELKTRSANTQKTFDDLKSNGTDINKLVDMFTKPTPGNRTSVAGQYFDDIVYNTIDRYNAGRIKMGRHEQQVLDQSDRYMLATELVYNLNLKEGNKARGLKEIIKDYDNRKTFSDKDGRFAVWDKFGDKKLGEQRIAELEEKYKASKGSDAFKKAAISEGYKNKQNLTKTVMQTLQLRIYELKGGSLDKGKSDQDLYQEVSYDASPELKMAVENRAGTGYTDFVPVTEKKVDKTVVLDGKEYKYPIRVEEAYNINTDKYKAKVADVVDNLPAEKLSFVNIGKSFQKEIAIDIQKELGLDPKMSPKVYVEKAKEHFNKSEELAFEGLEKTSNPEMYEPTNINKTIFSSLYNKTSKKFKSSEMPDFSETNARTFKFDKVKYKKGQLNDILFSGRDAGVVKKKLLEFFNRTANVASSQITRDKLSDPRVQDFIKTKDLNKFINLKAENVIPYVKEAIRGATPDKFYSKDLKVFEDFIGKFKKTDFNKFTDISKAYYSVKMTMLNDEQKILERHESLFLGEKGYNVGTDAIKEMMAWTKAQRNLDKLKTEAITPQIWSKKFKGINSDIIDILSKENISPEDLNRLTINNTIPSRVKDSKKYFEFVNELMDTMDPRLKSLMQKSYGDGSYKFNGKDYKTVQDKFTSTGKNEKLPFNIDHVKTVDNGIFKKAFMEELAKAGDLTNNPVARQKFIKMITDTYLTPSLTKKRIKELAKELKKGTITQKTYDAAVKPVTMEQTIKANEGLQKYMYGKLFDFYNKSTDKINAINQIQFLLQAQTSVGGGFSRALATHTAFTLEQGKMYSEHQLQVMNFNGNFLMNMIKNSGSKAEFNKNFETLSKQFKQSIIPKELQVHIDSKEQGGNIGNVYKDGYNTDLGSQANYLYATKLGLIVDAVTGKTYKELIETEVNASQTLDQINKIRKNLIKNLPKGTFNSQALTNGEIAQKIRDIDQAFGLARKRNKTRKGISVFDFDDTLARTNSQIIVTMPDGKKTKINATEFALRDAELTEMGAKYDFSEFNKVVDGKKGPLFDLAVKRQDKFTTKDVYVLTARPNEAAVAIHKFLKGIGLEIPVKNITGLADGRPEAKALWVLDKASKGYNDFYFADDAYKNVKAVQDVLGVIDVKSKVQQAFNSQDLSRDINSMIERGTGIGKEKTYSDFKAKVVGKDSGKTKLMASSAQDFTGLMYRLYGKGKQGNEDMAWVADNLTKPFNKANNAISKDKVSTMNDFNEMKKNLVKSGIPKDLRKEIPGEPFTVEQAIRVHTWSKQGLEVPGLSKADLKTMIDYVEAKPALMKFSQELIDLGKGEGYEKPNQNWESGTITTDLLRGITETRRDKYLEQSGWTENINTIFSKENMNKLEAAYGTKWREAMDNMLVRMKTGRNRPANSKDSKLENMALDWLNNSVGAIMFLNTKSAVLQTISAINYINWSDNNPLKAGQAMAKNPKQWAKTFADVFNSDFLIERRGGLKININENEIADAANAGGAKGVIATILKKGFVFTQIADSFAIASGGTSFYINRAKTYEKQGLSKEEAKKKAFEDFRELTEESQQSSRADRISQQQASGLGRVVLAFANTPSQYARLMQKAASDIKNNRGDFKTNMSKLMYYGMVQNAIFNALQTALFRDAFDDEEGIQSDTSYMANGMIDSILRGMGYQGAAIATVKGMVQDAIKQSGKKNPKYSDTALKILDMSPPIDSKISKLRQAGRTFEYDMDEVQSMGWSLDNPAYLATGQVISATTNIPLDRLFKKYNNIEAALNEDTEDWQSVALALGWTEWSLGMNEKGQSPKEYIRESYERENYKREVYKRE